MLEEARGSEQQVYEQTAVAPRWVLIAFLAAFGGLGVSLYMGHAAKQELLGELSKANQRSDMLAAQIEKSNASIADLKGELNVTSQKLGLTQDELNRARAMAQSIRKEQQSSDEKLVAQLGEVKKEQQASDERLGKIAGDVSTAKGDIEATRKDLEATKSGLQRVVGDAGVMSGLIARNREDLEELKRRGERNYYEFDIRKTNTPHKVGPIQVRLNKVDVKRSKFTLTLLADDKTIEKKDRTVNEPVQFYSGGSRGRGGLHEIVVFEVTKDRAAGYLSTPKEIARQ